VESCGSRSTWRSRNQATTGPADARPGPPRPSRRRRSCGAIGQGVVEYGLILALSALVALVVLVFFGGTLSAVLEAIGHAIDQAS
jgi:Flp pilus assembly pilin Flp